MKFRLGDKVKIIRNNDDQEFAIGTIGKITRVFSDHYKVSANNDWWYYDDTELKLAEPKKRWWQFWK